MGQRARGRPALVPDKRRSFKIMVSVTEAEAERLSRTATTAGMTTSEYVSRFVTGTAPPPVPDANRIIWTRLARAAANLNQLCAHFNRRAKAELSPELHAIAAAPKIFGELHAALSEVRTALLGQIEGQE